jgi:hypothetical protein
MQRCCDIPESPTMFEEINATYPECYQEYLEGKTDCRMHCGFVNDLYNAIFD